jgi:hypothetical protein
MDCPFPWLLLFPGVEGPPAFVIYSGIVLGIVGLVVAVGLWMMKPWSFWATIVVCVLSFLLGAPGVVMAPPAALKVAIAVTEVEFALIIVLVVVFPSSRRAFVASS